MRNDLITKAREYSDQQNNPNTRSAYILDLTKWFSFLGDPQKEVTVQLVTAWRDRLVADYSPSSARRIYSTVRSFYDWLRKAGVITHNPFELVKRPPQLADTSPDVPSDAEVMAVLDAAHQHDETDGQRHYAILCLLTMGLRAQEVCDLRCKDMYYDPVEQHPIVRVRGKGNRERLVPLNTRTWAALSQYVSVRMKQHGPRKPEDALIEDPILNRPITRHQVAYVCRKYGDIAGVQGFTPHSFRHQYVTRMFGATKDLIAVGKLVGHVKPETTKRYVRLQLDKLIEAARLDPWYTVSE